jgi:hypothetical protein
MHLRFRQQDVLARADHDELELSGLELAPDGAGVHAEAFGERMHRQRADLIYAALFDCIELGAERSQLCISLGSEPVNLFGRDLA